MNQVPLNFIWVTFQKEGIHCFPDAASLYGVEFLQHSHRHMFHFKVWVEVFHDDRDIEFILFKRELVESYRTGTLQLNNKSCEMIARDLYEYISRNYPKRDINISVSEDNENGAELYFPKE